MRKIRKGSPLWWVVLVGFSGMLGFVVWTWGFMLGLTIQLGILSWAFILFTAFTGLCVGLAVKFFYLRELRRA